MANFDQRRQILLVSFVMGILVALPLSAEEDVTDTDGLGEKLVKSALQLELEGDNEYRNLTLDAAIKHDPEYAPAHWQRGRVKVGDEWLDAKDAMHARADAEDMQEYERLRQSLSGSAKDQAALARFCSQQGLDDRARLHWHHVAAAPNAGKRELKAAVKALQLQRVGDQILDGQQAAELLEHRDQLHRDYKFWQPKLTKLVKDLFSERAKRRERALEQLRGIQDPAAVLALELLVSPVSDAAALEVVGVLERIDGHEATESLVRHAVGAPWPNVAQQAARALKFKPVHEYAPMLLNGLQAPIQTSFRMRNAGGVIQYDLLAQREGIDANYLMAYSYRATPVFHDRTVIDRSEVKQHYDPSRPTRGKLETETVAVDRTREGWRGIALADAQVKYRIWRDRRRLDAANEAIETNNAPVFATLETATDEVISRNPTDWWEWWDEYNEVHDYRAPKPTYYDYRWFAQSYQVGTTTYQKQTGTIYKGCPPSCFVAGTPIWTETGIKRIELVQPGDRVLSKDPDTGELAFKVVIQTTIRPPNTIMGIRVGDETIHATKGHPFWVNGEGWRMAKRLEAGQFAHTVDGAALIEEVSEQDFKTKAFNLMVADFGTYFVGKSGVLVHDNSYRSPTKAVVPGLIPAQRETDSAMAGP